MNIFLAVLLGGFFGFASFLLSISGLLGIFDISHLSVKGMNLGVIVGGVIFGIGFGSIWQVHTLYLIKFIKISNNIHKFKIYR